MPTDAGIEPRTVATGALAVRRSNHKARSHPHQRELTCYFEDTALFNLPCCVIRNGRGLKGGGFGEMCGGELGKVNPTSKPDPER